MNLFDARTAFLITGLLYFLMPLVVWIALRDQKSKSVELWCSGGELFGLGLLLISLRGQIPDWASYDAASLCMHLGNVQRIQALRRQLDNPMSRGLFTSLVLLFWLVFVISRQLYPDGPYHFAWSCLAVAFQCLWMHRLAQAIGRREGSRSARWLGYAYLPLAVFLIIRAAQVLSGAATQGLLVNDYTQLMIALMGIFSAVLGNTSFLAVFVERASRQRIQMTAERARREESERLGQQIAHLDRQRGMGLLAASLAHELSQPLTNITLVTELGKLDSRHDFGPDSAYARHFQDIERNARLAIDIMERIRGFIRARSSAQQLVQLQDVRDNVLQLMKDWLEQEQIVVTAPPPPSPVQVQADPVQLAQIIVNLVRNAGQACEGQDSKRIDIRLRREGDRALLEVHDSGPGFAPEVLQNNASTWYTTKTEGLGIGLSISRHIAEQHQGSLTIGNASTGGAIVTLSLPLSA